MKKSKSCKKKKKRQIHEKIFVFWDCLLLLFFFTFLFFTLKPYFSVWTCLPANHTSVRFNMCLFVTLLLIRKLWSNCDLSDFTKLLLFYGRTLRNCFHPLSCTPTEIRDCTASCPTMTQVRKCHLPASHVPQLEVTNMTIHVC